MVRAGVVLHPSQWARSSYRELCGQRQRYRLLDVELLVQELGLSNREQFRQSYVGTLDAMCERRELLRRELWWSDARVVGDRDFVSGCVGPRGVAAIAAAKDNRCFFA